MKGEGEDTAAAETTGGAEGAAGADQPTFPLQYTGFHTLEGGGDRCGRYQPDDTGPRDSVPYRLSQGREIIPVEDEIRHVTSYLKIQSTSGMGIG